LLITKIKGWELLLIAADERAWQLLPGKLLSSAIVGFEQKF